MAVSVRAHRARVSRQRAEGLVNISFAGLIRDVEYPALQAEWATPSARSFRNGGSIFRTALAARTATAATIQAYSLLLFAVTGFVLAIACANVANILLAQVTTRAAEMSVRLSLGASTHRVVRLLLSEAALLGILGGAGALVVGHLTISGMLAILPRTVPFSRLCSTHACSRSRSCLDS